MGNELKRKIQDFAKENFSDKHDLKITFYGVSEGSIMDLTAEFTTYVLYDESQDKVIVIDGTRGCIPYPVRPYEGSDHINLFYSPLNEQQQNELSDMLDDVLQIYENGFPEVDDDDERDVLMDEFEQLHDFISDWERRACAKMYEWEKENLSTK